MLDSSPEKLFLSWNDFQRLHRGWGYSSEKLKHLYVCYKCGHYEPPAGPIGPPPKTRNVKGVSNSSSKVSFQTPYKCFKPSNSAPSFTPSSSAPNFTPSSSAPSPPSVYYSACSSASSSDADSDSVQFVVEKTSCSRKLLFVDDGGSGQFREDVPHDHDYFKGFSSWRRIGPRDPLLNGWHPPKQPGVYEMGIVAPDAEPVTVEDIVPIYCGKAGGTVPCKEGPAAISEETLYTRYCKYLKQKHAMVAPWRERCKARLFRDIQRRGFTIWYRYIVVPNPSSVFGGSVFGGSGGFGGGSGGGRPTVDATAVESFLHSHLDYAWCMEHNMERREITLRGGKYRRDYPPCKVFPEDGEEK